MTDQPTLVRLRKIFSLLPNGLNSWELAEWRTYERHADSWRDYEADFLLPPGFTVERNKYGETGVYDASDSWCSLTDAYNGEPLLLSTHGQKVLSQVGDRVKIG